MNRIARLTDARLFRLLEGSPRWTHQAEVARLEWGRRFVAAQRRIPEVRRTYYAREA